MIKFEQKVLIGRLQNRFKRFFMEVNLDNKKVLAHVPNTGSMLGLLTKNSKVLLTQNDDPKRKLKYTVEAIEYNNSWVGINTQIPNKLIKASLNTNNLLKEYAHYQKISPERSYGPDNRSRIDLLLSNSNLNKPNLYIEIKNVTLMRDGIAQFPDAISTRAQKHIENLLWAKSQEHDALLLFVVQRQDCNSFSPAHDIDKIYAEKLLNAYKNGLKIRVLTTKINEENISLDKELPIFLPNF